MVACALQREQPDDHGEEHQVNAGGQKTAGKKKVVGKIDEDVNQGQDGGPAFRDDKLAARQKLDSAESERQAHQNHGWQIQPSRRGQSAEAAEHKQIKRNIKVALDGLGHGDGARVDGGFIHKTLLLLAKPARKGSVRGNKMAVDPSLPVESRASPPGRTVETPIPPLVYNTCPWTIF